MKILSSIIPMYQLGSSYTRSLMRTAEDSPCDNQGNIQLYDLLFY